MDDDEKRALFRALRPPTPASSAGAASSSSSSSSSAGSSIRSAPASPAPPPAPPSEADSDASTVEPPPLPDVTPCASPPAPPAPPAPQSPQRTFPRAPRSPSPSAASSASTVPPPSPAALERLRAAATPTRSAALSARAVVVAVDDRGIDAWEADEAAAAAEAAAARAAPPPLAAGYPRLPPAAFRFGAPHAAAAAHLPLSDTRPPKPAHFGVLPARVAACLSDYQRDGVTFMYRLFERRRGGLLADAMGLGKTVQTVAFLGAAFSIWDRPQREQEAAHAGRAAPPPPRILVVAPASVRENWRLEFERWTPFRVELYERAEEPTLRRRLRNGGVEVLIAGDHPVAMYGSAFFSKPLGERGGKWCWDVVIVDEIHVARNAKTNIHAALKKLPKTVMFGLTGTAVQNRLKELWSLMSLVVPAHMWPSYASFNRDFIDIINKGTKKDASPYMRKKATERITRLRKLLAKHIVRRPKTVVEDQLPGKTDYCVLMRMKRRGLQGYMYQRFQNSYDVKLLRDAKLPCDCSSGEISKECCHRYPTTPENLANAPIWRMHHKDLGPCQKCPNCICLYLQHYSRSLAAHALLIMPEDDESDREKAEFRKELFTYYLGKHAKRALGPLVALEQEANVSCKLNVALKLLKSFEKSGHKTIIFYESLRLGAILQRWATNKGLVYEVIDGSVNKGQRQGAVDRFNKNTMCSIFFISKKAGGTGLNICGADRVLIFEPCWNPTLDLQAGDRAHRLGQKRVVHIIRLVVENTIEHYVFKTAITKSQVSSAILDNTKEEWRIRENEIGSMHAMLRMGGVFSTLDSSQDEDYRMIEAEQLDEDKGHGANGNIGENMLSMKGDSGNIRSREDSSEEVDVMGDELLCSLDVDLDDDTEYFGNTASNSSEDEKGVTEAENVDEEIADVAPMIPESQPEVDSVLNEGGASGKLVMTSTSARKRKRQLMGLNATQRTSGINPAGAEGINFDDASWKDVPLSQDGDAVAENEGPEVEPLRRALDQRRAPRATRRRVTDLSDEECEEEKEQISKAKPVTRKRLPEAPTAKKTNTSPPRKRTKAKPPSKLPKPAPTRPTFAVRARVRR